MVNKRFKCSIIVFIISLFFNFSCTTKEKRIEKFISSGQKLLQEGRYKEAIVEFKNALQLDPNNPKPFFLLGKAYLFIKEYRKAYSFFLKAIELDPSYDEPKIEIASLLVSAKLPQRAIEYLEKIKHKNKFRYKITITKARAYIIEKKYKDAVDILSKLKNLEKDKKALALLSLCYKELRDIGNMKKYVKLWKTVDVKDPAPYLFMAQYWREKGDKEKVLNELNQMVDKNSSSEIKLLKAIFLEKFGFISEAYSAFNELPAELKFLKQKAAFYFRHKKITEAENILRDILRQNPKDIKTITMLAEILFNTNRVKEAYNLLDKGIQKIENKEKRELLIFEKARFLFLHGELEKAKELCKNILKENQAMSDAHILLGKILLAEGDSENAEIHLNQGAVAQPLNVEVQILLARAQLFNKKDLIAEETLKSALSRMPKKQSLRLELVKFYLMKKEYEKALKILNEGLSLDPNNIVFLELKGQIETKLEKYDLAEKDFKKIIEIRPTLSTGFIYMGRLYLKKKEYDKALVWFKEGYKKKGKDLAFPWIIRTYLIKNDMKSAIEFCKQEIANRHDSPVPYYYLGKLFFIKKDLKTAEEMFLKSLKLASDWQLPHRDLALVYLIEGKIDKAIKRYEDDFYKTKSLSAGITLALLYEYKKEYKKAETLYNKLISIYPYSPLVINNFAYFVAENYENNKERLEQARKLISKVIARFPENPDFLDTAAWIEYKLGNYGVASTYIRKSLLQNRVQRDIFYYHAAMIFYKLGKNEEALNYLNKILDSKDLKIRQKARQLKRLLSIQS